MGARWGWVVNATPRPLFSGKDTRYPLYRRLGGTQSRSGRVRKISLPRDSIFGPSNPYRVAVSTELSLPTLRLCIHYIYIRIIEQYIPIYTYTGASMHPRCKQLQPLCSWSGYGPGCIIVAKRKASSGAGISFTSTFV